MPRTKPKDWDRTAFFVWDAGAWDPTQADEGHRTIEKALAAAYRRLSRGPQEVWQFPHGRLVLVAK